MNVTTRIIPSALLFSLLFLLVGQSSCVTDLPYDCIGTRFFTLQVNGAVLDDHYTVRVSTNTKLRSFHVFPDNKYWVMDDSLLDQLKGKQETFVFKGIVNHTEVVSEIFIFRGGDCHVEKIYGKTEVDI